MNKKMIAVLAVVTLAFGATAFAAGPNGQGNGNGKGYGNGSAGAGAPATAVKPEGSQRRDGTFLTTGTTANGSTVRPGNGKGLMDGTGTRK